MISFSPSTTAVISSDETTPSRRPIRLTDSVRIWLILIHDRLGSGCDVTSSVNGKPAR